MESINYQKINTIIFRNNSLGRYIYTGKNLHRYVIEKEFITSLIKKKKAENL